MQPIKKFTRILKLKKLFKQQELPLDASINVAGFEVFEDVFINRIYADYFPFYEDAIVLDVGGHFGYFSLFSALNLSSSSQIYTLEPDPKNRKVLKANIDHMGIKNVCISPLALAGQEGEAELFLSNNANNSLVENYPLMGENKVVEKVKKTTLAVFMQENDISFIDFLKMDCEGAEYDIFESITVEDLKRIGVITMEFHDLKSPKHSPKHIVSKLRLAGFRIPVFEYLPSNRNLNFGRILAVNPSVFN